MAGSLKHASSPVQELTEEGHLNSKVQEWYGQDRGVPQLSEALQQLREADMSKHTNPCNFKDRKKEFW